ncbi:MAG: sulfotransferase [Candidatus Hermodarchaeota archaeon]
MNSRKPILVSGSHRSGTTWVGKILATSPLVGYIHEPFNIDCRMGICNALFPFWFTYITEENQNLYYNDLKETFAFQYKLINGVKSIRSLKDLGFMLKTYSKFFLYRRKKLRPLIKDPIALFSAEWLVKTFDMDVVILIRHPAAFASSLKRLNWNFPFKHFLKQIRLIEDHLLDFKPEIIRYAESEPTIIDQAILLWRIIHYQIKNYQEKHKDWLFIRHEDLSNDPIREFRSVFKHCDLEYTDKIQDVIKEYSSHSNPKEVPTNQAMSVKRNSRSSILNWKKRLTEPEIEHIKEKTRNIADFFYSETDW